MTSLLTQTMSRWIVSWTFQRAQMKMERYFEAFLSSPMALTHFPSHSPGLVCVCVCLCAVGDLIFGEMVQSALRRVHVGAEG